MMYAPSLARAAAWRPFVGGDPGGDPGSPSGEAMPTTARSGYEVSYRQDFNTNCAEGQFLTVYDGTYNATQALTNGRVGAYPTTYTDTRNRRNPTDGKYGIYDPNSLSVVDGILRKRIYWHAASGQMRVCAPVPRLSALGTWGSVLGGCMRVRAKIPQINTCKVAWLTWPQSGGNITGATAGQQNPDGSYIGGNGELDFPEGDLYGGDPAHYFWHRQNGTTNGDQWSGTSSVTVADNQWHTWEMRWIPGSYNAGTNTWVGQHMSAWVDGVQVGSTQTTRIPLTPMRWVLQTETILDASTPLDQTVSNRIVEIDWIAYDAVA